MATSLAVPRPSGILLAFSLCDPRVLTVYLVERDHTRRSGFPPRVGVTPDGGSMFLTFLMLLSLLVACTGPTGKPLRPVRAGETDLIVAVNGGGEDCGPGSCQGEMRLEVELRALGRALDSLEASSISVGVVTTRVSEGTPPWAFTLLPLSRDLSSVKSDLSRVPSNSVTLLNLGALVDQATIELARLRGCTSSG